MSSTTIRYSGVPENSHSRGFTSEAASDFAPGFADSAASADLASAASAGAAAKATASNRAAAAEAPATSEAKTAAAAEAAAHYGLGVRADGFYDWAGRRLFLSDGSPDPLTPGAYRYQASPDLCDLAAPESDPASPRYEPPHLRHRPGDDWEIGGKPYDPDDPGPFGSHGWRPDPRTGRHRRGELPDPLPPKGSGSHPPEEPEPEPEPASSGPVPPGPPKWRPPRLRTASPPPDPPDPGGESGGSPLPITPDQPSPKPRDRTRFWSESNSQSHTDRKATMSASHAVRGSAAPPLPHNPGPWGPQGTPAGTATTPQSKDAGVGAGVGAGAGAGAEYYRFDKLREDAWHRFLEKSADLAADHLRRRTLTERHGGRALAPFLAIFQWLFSMIRTVNNVHTKAAPPQPDSRARTTPQAQVVRERRSRAATNGAEPAHRPESTPPDQQRRTTLADRSTRLASAVRGAQRARIETVRGAAWA